MRVGILTTSFPRHEGDAAGAFVLASAQALAERGHQLEVLCPEPHEPGTRPGWPNVSVEWVPYVRPRVLQRTFYRDGAPENLAHDPLAWLGAGTFLPALVRAARGRTWDALISHWALPCALAGGVVRGRRPHLAVFHSADVWCLRHLPCVISRLALQGCTATWFVRRDMQRDVCERAGLRRPGGVGPMAVVEPDYTAPHCAAPSDRWRSPCHRGGPFRVLLMGRLVPIKGFDVALRALADFDQLEVWVAGEGRERNRLRDIAQAGGVAVKFIGTASGADKERCFSLADLLVVPSRRLGTRQEGVPTVALEAAIRGVPIVASDVSGLDAVFDREAVCFVPAEDPVALRSSVTALRNNLKRRQQQAADAERIAQAHTWAIRAEQMEDHLTR